MNTAITATQAANPFVGPRAIKRGEPLYGRDEEAFELFNQLVPDRIVLLYSPSGAGKTSLLQAKLAVMLSDDFCVWSPLRVNHDPPSEIGNGTANRYTFSAILSLDEQTEEGARLSLDEVAVLTFSDYVHDRLGEDRLHVLFFDQFEELLTIDPYDHGDKVAFLEDLSRALEVKSRWAVFAMREENLAAIDPYRELVPTRLRSGFRLDLLNRQGARAAASRLAADADRPFDDDALDLLVEKLSRIPTLAAPGGQSSYYVEPLHLQVVCEQLWDATAGRRTISTSDVEGIRVADALGKYVDAAISEAATSTGVGEKPIRDWIGDALISRGIRHQVRSGPKLGEAWRGDDQKTEETINALVDAHLVDRVYRRGTPWFELSHDKLIEPALERNEAWYEANNQLAKRARDWKNSGHDSLLLRGWEIGEFGKLAEAPVELEFVGRSKQERRNERLRRWFVSAIGVFLLLGAIGAYVAWQQTESSRAELEQKNVELEQTQSTLEETNQRLEGSNEKLEDALRQLTTSNSELTETNARLDAAIAEANVQRLVASAGRALATDPNLSLHLALASVDSAQTVVGSSAEVDARAVLYEAVNATDVRSSYGTDPATAIAVTADGAGLVAGYEDGSVFVWDISTRSRRADHRGEVSPVVALATPLARPQIVAAHESGSVMIWEEGTADSVLAFQLSGEAPIAAAVDHEATFIAAVGTTGSIGVHALSTGQRLTTIEPSSPALAVAVAPDGSRVYAGHADGSIAAWSSTTWERAWQPSSRGGATPAITPDPGQQSLGLAVSPNGTVVAAGTSEGAVRLWSASSGNELAELVGHTRAVTAIAYSRDGSQLWTASLDGTAALWLLDDSGPPLATEPIYVSSHTGAFIGLAPTTTNGLMAMATANGWPSLWEAGIGQSATVRSLDADPVHARFATGSLTGSVAFWDSDGRLLTESPHHQRGVYGVAFSPDGSELASASLDGTVALWSVEGATVTREVTGHPDGVLGVAYSPDGDRLATSSRDGLVRVWSLTSPAGLGAGDEIALLAGHEGAANVVAFSPDGRVLATGGDDGTVRLWTAEGSPIGVLEGHQDSVVTVAFSPAGQLLASAGFDETVRIWEVQSGAEVRVIDAPLFDTVYQVSWSATGEKLAVATSDRGTAVQVLDVGREVTGPLVVIPQSDPTLTVAYFGEETLAVSGVGGYLRLQPLDPDVLEDTARRRLSRELTEEECRRYLGTSCVR